MQFVSYHAISIVPKISPVHANPTRSDHIAGMAAPPDRITLIPEGCPSALNFTLLKTFRIICNVRRYR
jgi:hypothetical protein